MKRTLSLLAAFFVLGASSATAQQVTQQVSISFPNKAAIAVSGNPGTLELTTVDPVTGAWTSATDNSTVLYQVNNYGSPSSPLKITAQFGVDLTDAAPGLTLKLQAGGNAEVDLSNGQTVNLVTGITKGYASYPLTYTLSATSNTGAFTLTNEDVTLTITN